MQEANPNQKHEEIKVTNDQSRLERYEDLSGLTIKKLNFGLWWVMNVKFIKTTLFWFVISLGIIGWLYTFINYGYYLTVGTNKDDQMLSRMIATKVNTQNVSVPVELRSGDVEMFTSVDGRNDFVTSLTNINPDFYAEFDYSFRINGSSTPTQSGFILPNEQKNIISLGVAWPQNVSTVNLTLENVIWHRINRHQIPNWEEFKRQHMSFNIGEPQFLAAETSGLSEKINVSEITFTFDNTSPYNYYHLPLDVFLYSFDRVVGVTHVSLENIRSGESRSMRLNYPGTVGHVDRVSVVPDLNILKPDIYFK